MAAPELTPSSTAALRVQLHAGARPFLAAAEPFLCSDPFSTNVIAVVAARIGARQEPDSDANLWATITGGGDRVVGVAMHTPPHHVFVSRMPSEAAAALAHALADIHRVVPGVNGALEATRPFAATWLAATGQDSTLLTATRLYRLGILVAPLNVAGHDVIATTPQHVDLTAAWLAAFHDEAQTEAPVLDWHALAQRRVAAGQVHLWQDADAVVSLAAVSAPAVGVARVGPGVHTSRVAAAGVRSRGHRARHGHSPCSWRRACGALHRPGQPHLELDLPEDRVRAGA